MPTVVSTATVDDEEQQRLRRGARPELRARSSGRDPRPHPRCIAMMRRSRIPAPSAASARDLRATARTPPAAAAVEARSPATRLHMLPAMTLRMSLSDQARMSSRWQASCTSGRQMRHDHQPDNDVVLEGTSRNRIRMTRAGRPAPQRRQESVMAWQRMEVAYAACASDERKRATALANPEGRRPTVATMARNSSTDGVMNCAFPGAPLGRSCSMFRLGDAKCCLIARPPPTPEL